jgi:tetratricopeptide (TPR) repeat protein
MRLPAIALALCFAITASAQHQKPATIDAGSPEGQLLQQVENAPDDEKKLALLEEFAAKYPQHEYAAWVYDQLLASYTKAGQYDKAIQTGEKLLAIDPGDVASAYACLQAAEAKKDLDLIVKWSGVTSEAARKVAQTPKPADADAIEDWSRRVDYAKQADVRSEYSLYAAMLQTTDPRKKIQLGEALERRNPQSQYLPQMTEQRFQAYVQSGDNAKATTFAEKAIEAGQGSPEMLLMAANSAMSRKQPDKTLAYSKKAIAAAEAKPKPEGIADADWQAWKSQVVSRAHWMAGLTYAGQNKWSGADQELRAALPGVKGNREMLAQALFYVGLANYNLAEAGDTQRARDALRFSQECAAIPGPLQARARKNVEGIRQKYHIQ